MNTKRLITFCIAFSCGVGLACAQLQLLPDAQPQGTFAAGINNLRVIWRNDGDSAITVPLRFRVYQASSASAMPLGEPQVWKRLEVLSHQTVLETFSATLPSIKAETHFVVEWLDATNHVLGHTDLLAYPANLLAQLKPLAGDLPVGVLDPQNQLKPLLNQAHLEVEDLADNNSFSGRLAIIGPFGSRKEMPESLADQIRALAANGKTVVWIQPPPEPREKLQPSFYVAHVKKADVMIVQASLVADLPQNPRSQLNLLHVCRAALKPENPSLPADAH